MLENNNNNNKKGFKIEKLNLLQSYKYKSAILLSYFDIRIFVQCVHFIYNSRFNLTVY